MKIDAGIISSDAREAGISAKNLEDAGYDGAFTYEGPHDPFLPLVGAALSTEKIELMTSIAVAFARNPMVLANLGFDLNLLSKGRFILGLGSQIKPHITKRFSMPWSSPAARMKEMISAIQAIWDCWQNGTKLDFRGEFYSHTLMTPFFTPASNPYGTPKIYVAAVGPLMTKAVAESADGLLVHPFHTVKYMEEITLPGVKEGIDGLIATNTSSFHNHFHKPSGISGKPLFELSTKILKKVKGLVGQDFPIIASGGVMDRKSYSKKIDSGADLVQVYTGLIYKGPQLIQDILTLKD